MSFYIDVPIRLSLGGRDLNIFQSYRVQASVLTQPSQFTMVLGSGSKALDIIKLFPPETSFELFVNDVLFASGFTDGYELDDSGGATKVSIFGRDVLKALLMSDVEKEESFSEKTYADLVSRAVSAANVVKIDGELAFVIFGDDGEKKVGVPAKVAAPTARTVDQILAEENNQAGGQVSHLVQTHIGESWFAFITRHLSRAGMVIWPTPAGNIVLGVPSADEDPRYRLVRARGLVNENTPGFPTDTPVFTSEGVRWGGNTSAIHAHHRNDTSHRHERVQVFGRTGKRKHGNVKVGGVTEDKEMKALGYDNPRVIRIRNVNGDRDAFRLASRMLADERRKGWTLQYTVPGHAVPDIKTGQPRVWEPNTVVDVEDFEYGITGPHWIESVTFLRDGDGTRTELTLMRPDDLVFGDTFES